MDDKKHIVAITAFIKNKTGDKFLIFKRSRNEKAFPGKWAFPGGKLERGENFMQTLIREVEEEAGLEIEKNYKKFLKDYTFVRPDGHNVVGACFLVKALSDDVKVSKDFEEFKWITPEELKNFDHIEGIEKLSENNKKVQTISNFKVGTPTFEMQEEVQLAFAIKE